MGSATQRQIALAFANDFVMFLIPLMATVLTCVASEDETHTVAWYNIVPSSDSYCFYHKKRTDENYTSVGAPLKYKDIKRTDIKANASDPSSRRLDLGWAAANTVDGSSTCPGTCVWCGAASSLLSSDVDTFGIQPTAIFAANFTASLNGTSPSISDVEIRTISDAEIAAYRDLTDGVPTVISSENQALIITVNVLGSSDVLGIDYSGCRVCTSESSDTPCEQDLGVIAYYAGKTTEGKRTSKELIMTFYCNRSALGNGEATATWSGNNGGRSTGQSIAYHIIGQIGSRTYEPEVFVVTGRAEDSITISGARYLAFSWWTAPLALASIVLA